MSVVVERADLNEPDVAAIIATHKAHCNAISPPESCHVMAAEELAEAGVALWVARSDGAAVGIGALKPLGEHEGEVKSMHTLAVARGKGVGAAILAAILTEAARRGYRQLSLETGTQDEFGSARTLYERNGFEPCPPFGSYRLDPLSTYYTKRLDQPEGVE